jgi:NAD(P)-dependent dehydrogenase (short-subunit alcohol dehydrogenase family)
MISPLAIIAGVGPGVGLAVARRFADQGFRVALIARDGARLETMAATINTKGGAAFAYAADLSDHQAVADVIATILVEHGRPLVLVWNAAMWDETPVLSVDPNAFDRQLRLGLTAALTAVQAAEPAMTAGGGGTILMTGGGLALAPQGGGAVPVLTAVKSALRGFVQASAPAFAARNLRLGTVTIAGQVAPGTTFDPDAIANAFWSMHDAAEPKTEHIFDGT